MNLNRPRRELVSASLARRRVAPPIDVKVGSRSTSLPIRTSHRSTAKVGSLGCAPPARRTASSPETSGMASSSNRLLRRQRVSARARRSMSRAAATPRSARRSTGGSARTHSAPRSGPLSRVSRPGPARPLPLRPSDMRTVAHAAEALIDAHEHDGPARLYERAIETGMVVSYAPAVRQVEQGGHRRRLVAAGWNGRPGAPRPDHGAPERVPRARRTHPRRALKNVAPIYEAPSGSRFAESREAFWC